MKKLLKRINKVFFYFCIICAVITSVTSFYIFHTISIIEPREVKALEVQEPSIIYDVSSRQIETLGQKDEHITFEELPPYLINALLSVEDKDFYTHSGVDYKGVMRSFFNNIFSSSRQGGSTITQQLVKNLLLSNEVSLNRKIQEAYLALILEQNLTKEEILEMYFNRIYFDATVPGICYASKRFFNKDVSLLSLPECALLVGLVKSPSLYSPFKYISRADERKNVVLKTMKENGYISKQEYESAIAKHASTFVIEKGSTYKEETYEFQAYLDVVYEEVIRVTGLSPFSEPMRIYTYLDTSIQSYLDDIQNGSVISFSDDFVQIAGCIIDNSTAGVIGVIGGRNYNGLRLYNRAYNMKQQPASTIKPIFTYALAMEHLNYHEYSLLKDEPYKYPNSNIEVQNADKKYLGNISLTEALGYSRNTTTLLTLEKVIEKIGLNKTIDYLCKINLMDEGPFSYPYALGGMSQGVSPINLCASYSMLPRNGVYIKPSLIRRIESIKTGDILYDHENETKEQVLKEETSNLITSTLKNVRSQNYLNINEAFPSNIDCVGKTGTNAYDKTIIHKYDYPINADKDIWFAGYSKNYSAVAWTGFDEVSKEKKTYFGSNDVRRKYSKMLFKKMMEISESKNQKLTLNESLFTTQEIVSTSIGDFIPHDYIPAKFIHKVHIKKGNEITSVLPLPTFDILDSTRVFKFDKELFFSLNELPSSDLHEAYLGPRGYQLTIKTIEGEEEVYFYKTNEFLFPLKDNYCEIQIMETYENEPRLHSNIITFPVYENMYNIV